MDKKDIKIVKFSTKKEDPKKDIIELTEPEIDIKIKLEEIDKKVQSMENLMDIMVEENENTIFTDDVLSNIVGLIAVSAAASVLAEYFGIENFNPNNLL